MQRHGNLLQHRIRRLKADHEYAPNRRTRATNTCCDLLSTELGHSRNPDTVLAGRDASIATYLLNAGNRRHRWLVRPFRLRPIEET